MAPALWTHLAGSLTRHIWSHVASCCPGRSPAGHVLHRGLSALTYSAALPRRALGWLALSRTPPPPLALTRTPLALELAQPAAGMKTRTALKRRCKDCFFVRRRGRLFVYCKTNPRHKQRQG